MQTRIGASFVPGAWPARAARARNSGSRPRLTRAKPPDFTNILRVMAMSFPSRELTRALSSLKFRTSERQSQRERLIRTLFVNDLSRVRRHLPTEYLCVEL